MSSGAVRVGLTLENRAADTEETSEGISCRDRGRGSGKPRGWNSERQEWLKEFGFSGAGFQDEYKAGRVVLLRFCSSSLAEGGAGCARSAASSRTRAALSAEVEDHSPHFGTFQNASLSWAAPARWVMKNWGVGLSCSCRQQGCYRPCLK